MIIDNIDEIRSHLDFIDTKLDRYIIHILRRPKDLSPEFKNELGSNESQRLIRTYYVDSVEYFDRKIPAIKELCIANKARAYIIVQPKDNFECLLNLGKKIFDTIQNKNYSVKPEHLMRQAFCEWHKTRKKQWVIDLDENEMTETWIDIKYGEKRICKRKWTFEEVKDLVKKHLKLAGKSEDDMYTVNTKHGIHIITSPFNLAEAQKECSLMFEGRQKKVVGIESCQLSPNDDGHTGSFGLGNKCKQIEKEVTGWLHKDGMTLLWADV